MYLTVLTRVVLEAIPTVVMVVGVVLASEVVLEGAVCVVES